MKTWYYFLEDIDNTALGTCADSLEEALENLRNRYGKKYVDNHLTFLEVEEEEG